jgi:predicted metal-dependent enzyme (double-stranded beta helix superfamily)
MFSVERLIADCQAALAADKSHKHVSEVVRSAVSEPAAVLKGLGEPERAGLHELYRSGDLTILNVVWGPMMTIAPHNHNKIWAVIGIYTGREDNIFWRRVRGEIGKVEAAGATSLCEKAVVPLGPEIIHSVTNPIPRLTGAIHVYGGDFFNPGRREWDAETLLEGPFDIERARRRFEEANDLWMKMQEGGKDCSFNIPKGVSSWTPSH